MALKVITGKVAGPDGTNKAASITATLNVPTIIAGTQETVPSLIKTVAASDGTYTLTLQANNDMTPTGNYYTVTESAPDGGFYQFTIIVPQTAGPFIMSNIIGAIPALTPGPGHVSDLTVDNSLTVTNGPLSLPAGSIPDSALSANVGLVTAAQSVAYAASLTINATAGEAVVIGALTGNITINAPTNPLSGRRLELIFTQDATGGRTVTWNAVFKFATSAWQPNGTASKSSVIAFVYDGTNWQQIGSPNGQDIVGRSFTAVGASSPYTPVLADGVTSTPAGSIYAGIEVLTATNPYNPKAYGVPADAQVVADGSMNGTTGALTSASALFASGDVGKKAYVRGAGAAGALLSTTIASYQSSTQVTLTAVSQTAVSSARVTWGTDATTALNSFFALLPSAKGAWVQLRERYLITAGIAVPVRCAIEGIGGFDSAFGFTSGLVTATDGIDALTLNAHGCLLENFAVSYEGNQATSGSGIRFVKGDWARVAGVGSSAFWNTMQFDTGWYYKISDCGLFDAPNYGIYLRNTASGGADHGDQGIHNTVISKVRDGGDGVSALRWESGGGLRFTGNKINSGTQVGYPTVGKWGTGIELLAADGVTTGVMVISGNSIGALTTANAISIGTLGTTGFISKVVIVGNEISTFQSGVDGIHIAPAATWNFVDYTITGNTIDIQPGGAKCIYVKNLNGFKIGPNTMRGDYHVFIDTGCTNYQIDTKSGNGNGSPVYNAAQDNSPWYSGPVEETRAMSGLAASSPLNLWDVHMGTTMQSGCMVEVVIAGRMVAGVGGVARYKRFYVTGTNGAAPTVSAMANDDNNASGSTIDITATAAAQVVTLAITHTDAGKTFLGQVSLRVSGPMFRVTNR